MKKSFQVEPELELDSQEAILALVRHGLGVSVLPVIRGVRGINSDHLSFMPLKGTERTIVMVERHAHHCAHITAELMTTIRCIADFKEHDEPKTHFASAPKDDNVEDALSLSEKRDN